MLFPLFVFWKALNLLNLKDQRLFYDDKIWFYNIYKMQAQSSQPQTEKTTKKIWLDVLVFFIDSRSLYSLESGVFVARTPSLVLKIESDPNPYLPELFVQKSFYSLEQDLTNQFLFTRCYLNSFNS